VKPAEKDIALKISSISASFDGFYALTDVSVEVERNTSRFFIGPNGAGKTTLLDIICAKTKPSAGTVAFFPKSGPMARLTGMKERQIASMGIGRKFQVPSVFASLTVFDNMLLSLKGHKGIWDSIFRPLSAHDEEKIEAGLERADLSDKKGSSAGSLAHGQKQRLEIAMLLVQEPELILLDEPTAGMGKRETEETGEMLAQIKKSCTVIAVEHDMDFIKQAADMVTVLHEGKVLVEGSVLEVLADKAVQAVYLGRGGDY
jgi:urea transport system ATP-binding protein